MINYNDEQEHQATAAEHVEAIAEALRAFVNNNNGYDIALCSDILGQMAEALELIGSYPQNKNIIGMYNDMKGFIIK